MSPPVRNSTRVKCVNASENRPATHNSWWRAKIGAITPSVDLVSFQELQAMFPLGVLLLRTKIMLKENNPETLARLSGEALHAAELLASARPDVISYNCTSSAMVQGAEHEKELIREIEKISGARAT